MKRIHSIDLTRGIVMIIMALDHVRDLLHVNAITQSPTNLDTTTPPLFMTRWVTHLCAPVFVFLSGTSVYLTLQRSADLKGSRRFLQKRGLWLILLELTLMNFALFFDLGFHTIIFAVIATIGFGFIMLSLMSKWTVKTIAIIGLSIIFLHNLLAVVPFGKDSIVAAIINPLFAPGAVSVGGRTLLMAYPPIPWLGIMLVGYATGKTFEWEAPRRKQLFIKIGGAALLLFILLRFINIYGDPVQWQPRKNAIYTILSFINNTKYPPSLQFTLTMLGIMFLILSAAEKARGNIAKVITTYGKVPLFYYILHFYLIHIILIIVLWMQGISWQQMQFATGTFGRPRNVNTGLNLWQVYLVWITVVALLYMPCVWYARYKATHNKWWLKYI
ncbi:MAG: DUF1624 domain-containing protein [Niastella sp.]|nr:DUF1624 domain-containing protein [Niastella sp.]